MLIQQYNDNGTISIEYQLCFWIIRGKELSVQEYRTRVRELHTGHLSQDNILFGVTV